MKRLLTNRGQLVPFDGPAEPGDYITTQPHLQARRRSDLASAAEEVIRLRPVLSFRDGKIEGFDKLMAGVQAGETRECKAKLSDDAPNAALRGKTRHRHLRGAGSQEAEVPELTAELLDELGGFETRGRSPRRHPRRAWSSSLEYQQQQRAREQITAALTVAADWELPPELLQRQSQRELQRAVMELQRSGFSEDEIRAHENDPAAEQPRLDRPGPEGTLHPRADRRRREDRRRRRGLRRRNRADRRADGRVAAAGAGPAGKGGLDGRAAEPDHRAEGDRPDPRARQVQGSALQAGGERTEAVDSAAGGGEDESEIPEAKHPDEPEPTPGKPKK